ncbi:MAG: hypothetical protein GX410_09870 [Elusimicrobia bacterium]|nr:hypothetical protein [Elusimicrobiota bacterium]
MSFLKSESYRRGLVYSVFFNALARVLGFAASLAIAYYFGAGVETDIYFYCIFSAGLMAGFASNLNSAVLIPESMRLTGRHGEQHSREFLNGFLYAFLALGVAMSIIGFLFPVQLFSVLSRFSREALEQHRSILLLSVPIFTLMKISNYLSDILVSRKFFTMPMIAGLVVNGAVLLFIFLLGPKWGAASMAGGMLLAHAFNIALMVWLMRAQLGWNFRLKKVQLAAHVPKNVIFSQLGSATAVLSSYVPIFLLSGYGSGTVSSLNFGRQVAELPNSLLTQQASSVSGIKFNEMSANHDGAGLDRAFHTAASALVFALVPVAVAGCYFAPEVIGLLFKRGRFGVEAVKLSADFMRVFLLAVPFNAVSTLVSRLFMAEQKVSQSFWYQFAYNAVLLLAALFLIRETGVLGYPAAILMMQVINLPACIFLLRRYAPQVNYLSALSRLWRLAIYESALFFPVAVADALLLHNLPLIPRMIVACTAYMLALLFFNRHMALEPESRSLILRVLHMRRAKAVEE